MRIIVISVVLACLALPVNAHAFFCLPREILIAELAALFGERLERIGSQGDNAMVEIWVSDNGGFTILNTRPDGLSCVIASGKNWRPFKELPDIKGIPPVKEFAI